MPYGYPATQIDWVALSYQEGQLDPIPGESMSLTDYNVDGARMWVMKGLQGFDAPTVDLFYDELSGQDGGLYRDSRTTTRELFVPVFLYAETRPKFLALRRNLLSRIHPSKGPGRLVVTEGDATSRYIEVRYSGGAEGTYSEDEGGFFWQKYGLTFRAIDPFWYDTAPVEVTWTSGSEELKSFFGDGTEPFFGLRLNPSRAINGVTPVESAGDHDTWPVWNITGPVDGLTLSVSGASEGSFALNVSLGPGEVLHVDTRPRQRRIIKLTSPPILIGQNFWDVLEPGDQFWPLRQGTNDIEVSAGAVGPGTSISMTYRPRYYSV